MYRLVKFSSVNKIRRPVISTHQTSSKVCSLCGIKNVTLIPNLKTGTANNVLCSRQHTTKTDAKLTNELIKRKRFRTNKKFFTELLEVFSNDSSAAILHQTNSKYGEVPCITVSPNLQLDDLHKIMKNLKINLNENQSKDMINCSSSIKLNGGNSLNRTSNNLKLNKSSMTDISELFAAEQWNPSNSSKLEEDGLVYAINEPFNFLHESEVTCHDDLCISSPYQQFEESVLYEYELTNDDVENELITSGHLNKVPIRPVENEKRKTVWKQTTKGKLAKEKMLDLEKKLREAAFNTTLYTYLSLCVSCNFLLRALNTLHFYSKRSSSKYPKITDIRIFELVIHGFATKGYQNRVNEVLKMMTIAELKPSLNIFAAQIECASHSRKNKHLVPKIISSLRDMGYNLNDIFVKCTFHGDQRDVILNAIREVEFGFNPEVPAPSICYSCSLLQELKEGQGKKGDLKSPVEGLLGKEQLHRFAEEQLNNEFLFDLKVKSIEKRIESEGSLELNRLKLESMKSSWFKDLKNGFLRDVAILEMAKKNSSLSLLPYLKVLDSKSYIDIMMKEVQKLAEGSESFSPTTYQLCRDLGNQVKNRYIIKFKKSHGVVDKTKMLYNKYCDWYLDPSVNKHRSSNGRQEWQQLLHDHQEGPSVVGEEEFWPGTVLIGIGRFLYNIIVSDVKIDVNILNKTNKQHMLPAFYRVFRQQSTKSVEEIKPHPVISKLYRAAGEGYILFDITQVPMLSPPLPWTSFQAGGYLIAKTDLIRLPDQAHLQRQRLKEAPPEQIYPPLDSLNQLGSIPWIVNKPVLDTVIEVFNNGGSAKLEVPEPPYLCPVAEPIDPSMSKEERYQAYRQRMVLRRQKAEMYSLWCDALYKLSLANHFRDRIFWLPHNMDFRGRVYPCPPHLNHLAADMSRSLICFAQGKPLGPTGLDWLKIHLVNLLGTKKRQSLKDRLDYANSILPDILDSAENPLMGCKWWMESETPWQTLACCKEIHKALQHPGGSQHYVSHFPVHQDGSCNGLQHYAALGRDEAGATSVNLTPHDLPQDVYSCVAALVERERAKDSAAGVKVAQELDGFVRRKVIKQTVMTTVYGVTRFGARQQIAKQLKDIDSFPKEYVWPASTYLVAKTFESLREMFKSTREIQDWFTECARLVSTVCGENVEYVTPLGLPVVQHYSRHNKALDFGVTKLGYLKDYFPIDMFERPNVMKQKNAFPPNFIHSLDSCHMMLTSVFSEHKGITFVSVHDCYWTHACTVHIMNQICREQFVALHSQPILEDLSNFMLKRYNYGERDRADQGTLGQAKQRLHHTLSQVPSKGTFILENVLDSIYFFS